MVFPKTTADWYDKLDCDACDGQPGFNRIRLVSFQLTGL